MDSKYANLPGIARNEPDLYETSDITQTDTKYVEDDSSNVTKIIVDPKEVYEKFNKSNLNSRHVDFSDSLNRKHGYLIDHDIFEWNSHETPVQKFNRLQREMDQLKQELNELKLNEKNENVSLEFDPIELLKQVENLKKQVTNLQLEQIGAKQSVTNLDGSTKKQLLVDHFNDLKKSLGKVDIEAKSQEQSTDKSMVFKIFNDLETSELNRVSKLSDLSQRLDRLEATLGANKSDKLVSSLCANTENKSILGVIDNLNLKINLVSSESIDQIDSKLQMVVQKITQINEKKQTIEDQEKLAKVTRLFDMINKWKDVSANLPNIIERLTTLNDLHQQAFNFSSNLNRIDSEQTSMRQILESNADSLTKLKSNLEKNLESIKENFEKLNERIVKINSS